jgi:hypothetical protein
MRSDCHRMTLESNAPQKTTCYQNCSGIADGQADERQHCQYCGGAILSLVLQVFNVNVYRFTDGMS